MCPKEKFCWIDNVKVITNVLCLSKVGSMECVGTMSWLKMGR